VSNKAPEPFGPLDFVIDIVAFVLSLWFCWYFLALPVKQWTTEWLQPHQVSQPKSQQRLP
jgi:hypothetical protein